MTSNGRKTSQRKATGAKAKAPTAPGLEAPPLTAQVRTLENGLEVIVREDHQHPLVSVQIWVRAGSLHEEKWTGAGLAHCVEHMLFKGTYKRSAAEISQSIQELGGYVNAYTTFNRTVYYIDGLAEHAEGYLEILADMVRHAKIDAAELEKEQDVIRREMAMDNDDPGSVVQHLVQATGFREHPLRHPIIGHRQVFDQVSREDVAGFMKRHYAPNNCFVVIAGAVNARETFAAVQRHLGEWERRPYEPVLLPEEPRQMGLRENAKDFATELTRVALGWQIPGEAHPDKPALDVLGFLLGSGRSSRLYQELREKRGIAHWVWAGAWGAQECGLFNAEVECDPKDAAACRKAMLEVIDQSKQKLPRRDELDKAVRATVAYQVRSLATTRGQAAALGRSWLTTGGLELSRQYLAAVRALTPGRIREVARQYLLPETCSVVTVGPATAAEAGVTAAVAKREEVKKFTLPNGLTLLVTENPRLPLVAVRAQFLAGVLAETDDDAGVSQVTAALMLKGTKKRTATQIAEELENVGGALHCSADAHRFLLGADVMRGDEERGLELLADLIQNARLPAAELADVKKTQLASIQEEKEDPLTVALRRARREIFAGQPFSRTSLGTEETVKALKVEDCRALMNRAFVAGNGVVSIAGDVKAESVRRQVEKAFGRLKGRERLFDAAHAAAGRSRAKAGTWEVKMEKEQAVVVIGFRTVGLHEADNLPLMLIDEACSDMGSRLFNRIREELGLAYYVGAQNFGAMGAGAFYFYAGTDPKKADLAQGEMLSVIEDLAKNGLEKDELQRAKTTWRSSWLRSQQGNASLADAYGWNEINGLGFEHFQRLPELVDAVSAKDIQRAAKTYFARGKAFTVRIMPKEG
jgi:zinc protease